MSQTELLTITEVSVILHCSRQTVYNLIHEGKIKTVKFGERSRIRRSELAKFINSLPRGN